MQLFCWFSACRFLLIRLSALHCTLFPFVSSSWVHTVPWCQASSGAAAEPNRREWGRRGERKWQTRAGGILGAAKNSPQKRRGERWRVCRHDDKRNTGWVIFGRFKNEMFCSQKRRGELQQLSARSPRPPKQRPFLIYPLLKRLRRQFCRCKTCCCWE